MRVTIGEGNAMNTLTQAGQSRTASPWRRSRLLAARKLKYNFIVIFFALVIAATFLSDNFLTFRNISNLFQQASIVGIVAIGMTFVILTANIDLSVGSMVACGGMVSALLMSSGINPVIAVLAALLVGGVVGGGMGAISAYAKVPS